MEIARERQHQRDLHHLRGLQLEQAEVDPALRAHADDADDVDRDQAGERGAVDHVGPAEPDPDVGQRDRQHQDQADRRSHAVAPRPGSVRPAGGRVQHAVAGQADQDHDRDERPVQKPELLEQRQLERFEAERERGRGHAGSPLGSRRRSTAHGRPHPDRIELERLGHDVARDRRRRLGAAAAVLDDHRERVARLRVGRERDEQRVIAFLPGLVLVLAHAGRALGVADPADLRGPGLAGERHRRIAEAGLAGGAALAVDDLVHALPDEPERPLGDAERGRRLDRRCGLGGGPGADQPRRHRPAAVGDPCGHDRELQGRRLHVALADAGDQRLAELPGHATGRPLPAPVRHQPGALAGQVDPERLRRARTGAPCRRSHRRPDRRARS